MLRGMVLVGGVVLAVGVVAELTAPRLVEAGIEETVRSHTDGAARVEAHAWGTPFVPDLLVAGVVRRVDVDLHEVAGLELRGATLSLQAEGIQLDRGAMYRGDIEITDIETGTAVIELHADELGELLGSPVDLDPAVVELAGTALEVAGTRLLEVPVDSELLPCTPELEVEPPRVRLSCTFDGVPAVLRTLEAVR